MRRCLVMLVWLATCVAPAWSADGGWVWRVGGGPLYPTTDDGRLLGRAFAVEAAKPLRPWCTLGLEAAWLHLDEHGTYGWSYFEQTDAWNDAIVAVRVRLQGPARVGPVPFVEASNGVSWPSGGGSMTVYPIGTGGSFTTYRAEASSLQWVSSVGIGLRVVLPGRWPEPEIGLRKHLWDGGYVPRIVEPRVAISW